MKANEGAGERAGRSVLVVGAGIAGLACAVHLSQRGRLVTLIEQSRVPGGRARSFFWREAGCELDTGPHLAMGCYRAFRSLLKSCGRELPLQRRLRVEMKSPGGSRVLIRENPGGLLISLILARGLAIREKLALARGFRRARELKNTTYVEEWLDCTRQPRGARRLFWEPFVTAVLNQAPDAAPSLRLYTVLRRAFLDDDADPRLSESKEPLNQLVVGPAIETIRRFGGEVLFGRQVHAVDAGGVLTDEGRHDGADVVLAVPPDRAAALLPGVPLPRFEPVPIVSAHLLLGASTTRLSPGFLGLLDSDFHWLFVRKVAAGWLVSVLTSNARELVSLEPSDIETRARQTLVGIFPWLPAEAILATIAVKDRAATFVAPPGWQGPEGLPPHLYLAGDWTVPEYPGTLEAAALSGQRAARAILAC